MPRFPFIHKTSMSIYIYYNHIKIDHVLIKPCSWISSIARCFFMDSIDNKQNKIYFSELLLSIMPYHPFIHLDFDKTLQNYLN